MSSFFETIIVGGGMSGIGCARTLGNHSFVMISKEIGGRVQTSHDGNVNYGAYYARADYYDLLPFIRFTKRIRPDDLLFKRGTRTWKRFDIVKRHPVLMSRFFFHLIRFDFHYQRFKCSAKYESQKSLVEKDPHLKKLFSMEAKTFLHTYRLEKLIPEFIDPVIRASAFLDVEEQSVTAGFMLLLCLILLHPTYEFVLDEQAVTNGFREKIILDEVVSVQSHGDEWSLKTQKGYVLNCKRLVMATPILVTKRLLNLSITTNQPVSVYMTHVNGVLCEDAPASSYVLFPPHRSQDIVLTKEIDGTFLLYSHSAQTDLAAYFKTADVIAKKYWHPAFCIGPVFIETEFSNNLFVIGDHNISGIHDAFLTGVYAANRIKSEDKK